MNWMRVRAMREDVSLMRYTLHGYKYIRWVWLWLEEEAALHHGARGGRGDVDVEGVEGDTAAIPVGAVGELVVGRHGGMEAEVVGGAVESGNGGVGFAGAELALDILAVTIDEPQPHTNGPVGDLDGVTGVGVGDGLVDTGGLGGVGHGELHGGLLVWGKHGDGTRAGGEDGKDGTLREGGVVPGPRLGHGGDLRDLPVTQLRVIEQHGLDQSGERERAGERPTETRRG